MGNTFEVVVGEHSITSTEDGTRHSVCGTTVHPNYNDGTTNYDYAIVRLSQPVQLGSRAVPACLPGGSFGGSFLDDKTMTVSGWGSTSQGGNQAEVLMSVDVPGMSNQQCGNAYGQYDITNAMMCAGRASGGIDSCQGDSGGPLTYTTGTPAKTYIVGIVSWGIGCAQAGNPGVYSRVTHVLPWINEQMTTANNC
jgi:trypsin